MENIPSSKHLHHSGIKAEDEHRIEMLKTIRTKMNSVESEFFEDKIVLYSDIDGEIKLDVSLENDTVWLSQKQMSVLFDKM